MADRNHSERINFGKLREVIQPPNLIEIQITSYLDFLQKGIPEKQRKPQGLEAVFREVFPILSYDERLTLEGAKKRLLAESRKGPEQLQFGLKEAAYAGALRRIRDRLTRLRARLSP